MKTIILLLSLFSIAHLLHKMNIFFDESNDIWLDEDSSEFFDGKPFVADKSLFFLRFWFRFSGIFYEEKEYILVNHRWSLDMRSDKCIVNLVHELDDMKLADWETCFFGYLPYRGLHCLLIFFNMSLWEYIFESSSCLPEGEHEYLKFRSFLPIHNTASTLFMEFCHKCFLYWDEV